MIFAVLLVLLMLYATFNDARRIWDDWKPAAPRTEAKP